MRSRIGVGALILALCAAGLVARKHLAGFENPIMAVWPGQVIFGFYFAVLAVASQALRTIFVTKTARSSTQALLLLVIIGLCLDLVLVNVQETAGHVDASYGLVALWDSVTFFVWIRAVELCRPEEGSRFRTSLLIGVTPIFALGREILFLPYSPTSDPSRAYLDLGFGNLLVSMWLFASGKDPAKHRGTKALLCIVFTGCVYWLINAIENIAFLVWSPLAPSLYGAFGRAKLPVFLLSCSYAVVAGIVTFVVWRWDVFRLGTRFGIAARRKAPKVTLAD